MAATVKTRVLIISDTHCAGLSEQEDQDPPVLPFKAPLPPADLLIHCGDLTLTGTEDEYHQTLDMLNEIDAPVKLVIAGNHDLTLDRDFVTSHLEAGGASGSWEGVQSKDEAESMVKQARSLWLDDNGRAKTEGVTFLEDGVHEVDLANGATVNVYASPYTPEFCDWAYAYGKDEDRFNSQESTLQDATNIAAHPVPSHTSPERPIDICITHGPPYKRLDKVERRVSAGCPHLLKAVMRARPLIHCFGHIHEGWGAEFVDWSPAADEVATAPYSTTEWQQKGWRAGVQKVDKLKVDLDAAKEQHGVFVDLTSSGSTSLQRGATTMIVNASIMNVMYRPVNAPWVIDIDLSKR